MSGIVPSGRGHLLTARGTVLAERELMSRYGMEPA